MDFVLFAGTAVAGVVYATTRRSGASATGKAGTGAVFSSSTDGRHATEEFAEMRERMDWEQFRSHGREMVDYIADYYANVEKFPVKSKVMPGYLAKLLPSSVPEAAEPVEAIMADVKAHIVPGITHWQHPSFFAYFPSNTSYPGLLGDMLASCFNVIGFSWIASPAATELEAITLDWLGDLIGLPEEFLSRGGTGGGVIQGTASEATIVALLASRARAVRRENARRAVAAGTDPLKEDSAEFGALEDELGARWTVYASDQAHSSAKKACMVAGIPLARYRSIKARADAEYSLDTLALAEAMRADAAAGLQPLFVLATCGTTSSGAFDDLVLAAEVAREHGAWVHVDAAWAGSACVCPEHRVMLRGIEACDSLDFNPHKWLLTNFNCSTMWCRDKQPLLQALSLTPEYLRSKEYESHLVQDYRDWQVPLGRRFHSLKLFFVLRAFGAKNLRSYIREHIALGERFEQRVRSDSRFELVTKRSLSLVCLRLRGANSTNERLLELLNEAGATHMVHTKLSGQFVIRFAAGNPRTETRHVDDAWAEVVRCAELAIAEAVAEEATAESSA